VATKTLNIALDENLLKEIDKTVKKDMGTRSEYFRRLALRDLERRRDWDELFASSNKKGREIGITGEQQVYDIIDDYKREKREQRKKLK